jgi:hypothetical protein
VNFSTFWPLLQRARFLTAVIGLTLWVGGSATVQAQESAVDEVEFTDVVGQLLALDEGDRAALPEDVQGFLDDLGFSPWIPAAGVSLVSGYRDNIGLNSIVPSGAAFGEARLEGLLLWQPEDSPFDARFIADGFYRHYAGNPVSDADQSWYGQAEFRWQPGRRLRLWTKGQGFYRDEVADLSTTAAQRTVLPVELINGASITGATLQLPLGLEAESRFTLRQANYRLVPEDYRSESWWHGVRLSPVKWFGVDYGRRDRNRDYDARREVTPGGRPIEGSRLSFEQTEEQFAGWAEFDFLGEWSLQADFNRLENRDGTSGFYDYDGESRTVYARWRSPDDTWEFGVEWEESRYDYLNQTVGGGLTPPAREREDRWIRIEAVYRFGFTWELRLETEDLSSASNEVLASYRDRIYWAGLSYNY